MASTFGDQLVLFALSVDVVGVDRFNRVNQLVNEYCRGTLGIETTKLYLSTDVDGRPALKRYGMGSHELESLRTVRTVDGAYNGQTSLAFDRRKPIWIVSATGKQQLANTTRYADQWSRLKAIPTYKSLGGDDAAGVKTSIVVPVPDGSSVVGVVGFETSEYIEITEEAKSELSKIAEALGVLIRLFRAADAQKSNTEAALENLQALLSGPLPKLTKPMIFLASSSDAEADVVDAILGVLRERAYTERMELVYWKAMDQPGNINRQLLEAIAQCRYGLCYFSQKNGEGEYTDNVNVVFEAGMFHGRVDELTPVPASWIPIREVQSPDLPFDFAQERILWVERARNGALRTKAFAAALRRRLDAMLAAR